MWSWQPAHVEPALHHAETSSMVRAPWSIARDDVPLGHRVA